MYEYIKFLRRLWRKPQTFQSDYSRAKAAYIAEAASLGHITAVERGIHLGCWHITSVGLEMIEKYGEEAFQSETPKTPL